MTHRTRARYRVTGVVQGVGFRPFVYVTATSLELTGWVANDARGVVVEVEGRAGDVDELGRRLATGAPPMALVESVTRTGQDLVGGTGFTIAASDRTDRSGARTFAGPDVATCADCLRELTDPADRRFRHPFISCTNCGPRFTHHPRAALRPARHDDGGVPDVRRVRRGVRRPGGPAVPRPADRLPRLRPGAGAGAAGCRAAAR